MVGRSGWSEWFDTPFLKGARASLWDALAEISAWEEQVADPGLL